jgi:hypothetical protein
MGVFSFDTGRKAIVFRQFHVEDFVSQYLLEPASTGTRLVLTTESIENIPAGWCARETHALSSSNELEEVSSLAEPGKPFELYSRSGSHAFPEGDAITSSTLEARGLRHRHNPRELGVAPLSLALNPLQAAAAERRHQPGVADHASSSLSPGQLIETGNEIGPP